MARSTATTEKSDQFLANVLGLDLIGGGRMSTYMACNMGPWYVVVLPTTPPDSITRPASHADRLPEAVEDAREGFSKNGKELGIHDVRELQSKGSRHLLLSDINRNWWEITS